jgi:dipeptidyl aminopeptidase/acylaminoacyl peptidase
MVRWGGAVRAVAFACAVTIISTEAALAAQLPVEAYGNLPLLSDAQISPDGKNIAVIAPVSGAPGAVILSLVDPTIKPKVAAMNNAAVEGIFWANNNRLICYFYSNYKSKFQAGVHHYTRAVSVAVDGSPAVILMNDKPLFQSYFSTGAVLGKDQSDPNYVFMAAYETNAELNGSAPLVYDDYYLNLFRVDVNTGGSEVIHHGDRRTTDYMIDGQGHILATLEGTADDLTQHIMVGTREVGSFSAKGGVEWDFKGITFDQSRFAVLAYGSQNTQGLFTYQLGGAGLGQPLFSDPNFDVSEVLSDPSTWLVDGVAYADDELHIKYFDPAKEHIKEKLEAALPGEHIQLMSHDAAKNKYAVFAEGPKDAGTYYIFDASNYHLDEFRRAYPTVTSADISDVKPYPYKSSDGTDIHAYLTLPAGKPPKNLPTVIFPHGGPEARDMIGFDWWAQFMASRGYAVLQPNFRGSSGYGLAFRNAGFGEWAGKVQDDLTAGVNKMVADGIADPKRICIVGASYGGYSALAGATFHPDLYACAISYAGLSDLSRVRYRLIQDNGNGSTAATEWDQYMGSSDVSRHESDASPAEHADRVKVPVLLLHSQNDVTVQIEQSEIEESALKSAGKQVEFIKLDGDDHYLHQEKTRTQVLTEVERFLKAHIGS